MCEERPASEADDRKNRGSCEYKYCYGVRSDTSNKGVFCYHRGAAFIGRSM